VLKRRQHRDQGASHNPTRGEARDPRERKGSDGRVKLLGRSHQGRLEAEDTRTMISHGVEILNTGGRADEEDEEAVTLTPLIYPANSFWWVVRPQLILYSGRVPMDLTLLGSTQLHSCMVLLRCTIAGAAGGR